MNQINHSVYPEYLGVVNGLGQSLAAAARAIGPALGGLLWSISIQKNFVFLNFLGVMVVLMLSGYVNRLLPESINYKKGHGKKKQLHQDGGEGEGGGMMMAH